jgi:hypothetical protein
MIEQRLKQAQYGLLKLIKVVEADNLEVLVKHGTKQQICSVCKNFDFVILESYRYIV